MLNGDKSISKELINVGENQTREVESTILKGGC